MKHGKRMLNNQSGSVVLMAVFLVFFISVLMITLELMRLSDIEIISNHIEDMQTYYCAEAGIEYEIRRIRNANANPATRAANVACPTTTRQNDCSDNRGSVNTGWTYRIQDKSFKADPNYTYCNYEIFTSIGCKGSFGAGGCSGQFARSVQAIIRRTNQSTNLRYIQVIRWREL
ncbi:MAG: hypothetical protein WCX65_12520 [bacterium]